MNRLIPIALIVVLAGAIYLAIDPGGSSGKGSTSSSAKASTIQVSINGTRVDLEIADTAEERSIGLSGREELRIDYGMLFVFKTPTQTCFWMKDTKIPLDIAFINLQGKIIKIATMQPDTLDQTCVEESVPFVIELEEGWFQRHGVREGYVVDIITLTALLRRLG